MPGHLKNANRRAKGPGHGEGYVYPHEVAGHHGDRQYLPAAVPGTYFDTPSEEGYQASMKERLARWRAAQEKALGMRETTTVDDLSPAERPALDLQKAGLSAL